MVRCIDGTPIAYRFASGRLLKFRQSFIQGPRSAMDNIPIDHLPKDHWCKRRMEFITLMGLLYDYTSKYEIPWFWNVYSGEQHG